eukprot:m.178021 g.178021  ORF g.178021 m.178021 type:complete len:232 (+) comp17974_c0_seq9:292-987(+)
MAALLHQLEDMAGAILTEVLRFEVVAADPESPASNPVPDARFEQWLRHQTYEYDAAVKQSEANALMDPSPIDPESPEYLAQLKKLDALRNELREVAAQRVRENMLAYRLRAGAVITEATFPGSHDLRDSDETLMAPILSATKLRDQVSVQFLQEKEQVQALQDELETLKVECQRYELSVDGCAFERKWRPSKSSPNSLAVAAGFKWATEKPCRRYARWLNKPILKRELHRR